MTAQSICNRRTLLKMAGLASAAGIATIMLPKGVRAQVSGLRWDRTLVLIKLNGGNDGLNTLVPYSEPLYYQYRPTIALSGTAITKLDARFALNSVMNSLLPAWNSGAGDMAAVLGVGYPNPLGSHFKSSDIWATAVPSLQTPTDGWLARMFAQTPPPSTLPAEGLVIGPEIGALAGQSIRTIVDGPGINLFASAMGNDAAEAARNPTYGWVAGLQQEVDIATVPLNHVNTVPLKTTFPDTPIGDAMSYIAQLVISGIGIPAISLDHGPYDTHHGQVGTQGQLLGDLANAIAAFRQEMITQGQWSKVLVMTHSEFGRCAFENSGQGTDHGQANVHFMFGGDVKGGYYGNQYPISTIQNVPGLRSLAYQVDFRQLYATIMQNWWNASSAVSASVLGQAFTTLPILAA